ncbi:DUF294 nucleotidyltransferase-like domain-containing protein [Desulfogranum mediterraneum]|uniref:DUF294 nucleotidyltransferase-like domain-containing protein n=1 Tax=Desulfogranum mediterraneum TaxID=160661 RepID=UPI0004096EAB|nr:DUF294 nucleotidyltransferase-like domain-containing protein [Desulfogranum mediterraneum]
MSPPQKDVRVWRPFIVRIILPSLFAITLFVAVIFFLILPSLEKSMMSAKREMIKELSIAAWSIIDKAENLEKNGSLSRSQAQEQALLYIQYLRYGDEIKDYFWVMDLTPRMLMHPYRSDLIGKDLNSYTDQEGRRLFVDFVRIAKASGDGYVQYFWESKDEPARLVPKLSYVKNFEPWGWIIGTGIYLDDVRLEIRSLTNRLLGSSLAITLVIASLLFVITRESMKIEARRQENEARLREAGEKYKTLVEASTEGVMMIIDQQIIYANKILERISGYSEREIIDLGLADLIVPGPLPGPGISRVSEILSLREQGQLEVLIRHKCGTTFDALLSVSPIEMGGRQGVILIIKDISTQKQIDKELGSRQEKFEHLTDNIAIGVFRTTFGDQEVLVEANPAAARIFGMASREELFSLTLKQLFTDPAKYQLFVQTLRTEGRVSDMILDHSQPGGARLTLSLTGVVVCNESGRQAYCDGLVEDITERYRREQEREGLLSELQASLLFQNEPIHRAHAVAIPCCQLDTSIELAARFMVHAGSSAILVQADGQREPIGILTDNDIRERVVAAGLPSSAAVSTIMSAPLIGISADALVFEGIVKMLENRVDHLLVRDATGAYYRVISAKNLLKNQQYILTKLISDIERIESPLQLAELRDRLPRLVQRLFDSAPDARNLTRIISAVAEAIMRKCLLLAVDQLGQPPCRFAFMALGSVGREEQTLVTDQDNALIYEDVDSASADSTADYFHAMGELVCTWLDQAGYALCKGEVMAKNPKWCQPVSVWEEYFRTWVSAMEPADLLDTKIFFDFRWVYGDQELVDNLRGYLHELTAKRPLFFYHLAQNCLQSKPPLNIFKNIVVESSGEHREKFSIKKAMTPLVDYTRIYALRYGIGQTNTFARFRQLLAKGHLSDKECQELTMVYKYLLELRFKHQILALGENREPDNYINPKLVTEMEQVLLREALVQVADFQTKMGFDFKQV